MTRPSCSFAQLQLPLAMLLAATVFCPAGNAQRNQPQGSNAVDIANAIQDLGSTTFSVRHGAYQVLAAAGSEAVSALEQAARSGELETATRCVEVLAQIAGNSGNTGAALAALERLAADSSNRIAELAARTVIELKTTDEDRAIAALEVDGVRLGRGRDGEVFSARVSRDPQLVYLKHLPQLRSVRMRGQEITDVGVASLADVKPLSDLMISGTAVTDSGLRKMKSLKSLRRLSLSGQTFTSDGLRQLRHVASLRTLSFHSSIEGIDLSFLAELPQVDSLYISNVRLDGDRVRKINQLEHVRRFHLSITGADDEDLCWLGKVEVPLHLSVTRSVGVTDAGLESLAGARLLGLSLARTPVTDKGLAHVGTMSLLESLTITDAPISDAGLEHLKNLKALRTLVLRNTKATEEAVENLQRFLPNLTRPRIVVNAAARIRRRNRIGFTENPETGGKNAHFMARPMAEDIERLKRMPDLDTVFLSRDTKDEDLLALAPVTMKGVVIDSIHVTDRGVQALADHSTLESLGLWSSSITDKSLKTAAQIRSLTKLAIHKAEITDEGVRGLIARLVHNGKLKTLHFFRCPRITDAGLRQIDQLTSLEQLFLNSNSGLTSGILKQVARLRHLRRLEIDSIELDEADLVHLEELTKLQTLGMSCSDSSSKLSDRGLSRLTGLTSLQSLTIQRARVTDRGVASLVQLPALQRLGLAYTEVGDLGIAALVSGLPNLSRLSLAGTNVTDSGMTHIGKLTQLEWLWLNETEVGDEGIRHLDRLEKLQHLYVDAAKLSNEAHQHFQRGHPTTQIHLQ